MRKNDDAEDEERLGPRLDGHPDATESGSDRGQFIDVIDENASRAGGSERIGWVVEWQAGGYLQFFH